MRILVVDDQVDILLMLQKMLEKTGHAITLAQDSRNALTMVEHIAFDAFVIDLRMPKPTGHDLIRKIRQCKPSARIVAITADHSGELDIVGPDGADHLLIKPFTRATLIAALASDAS